MLETVDNTEINLDVVNDVTGVDSPYEEYVDEWNKDVPEIGDDAIEQVYDDTGRTQRQMMHSRSKTQGQLSLRLL